jgi:hypothetical protein
MTVGKVKPRRVCNGKSSEKKLEVGRTPEFNFLKKGYRNMQTLDQGQTQQGNWTLST